MSISNLITDGFGAFSEIKYVITGGLEVNASIFEQYLSFRALRRGKKRSGIGWRVIR